MANHRKSGKQRRNSFIEGKGELGGADLNKESVGGNWELEV